MKTHKSTIFLVCVCLSIVAIIISFLLGPGKVAPGATIFTYVASVALLLFEFLYLKEKLHWGVLKIVAIILVSLVPQLFVLVIGAFLWFITLPTLLVVVVFRLIKQHKQ